MIVGVDMGFSGALAFINEEAGVVDLVNMPLIKGEKNELDEGTIKDYLVDWNVKHAYLEKAQTMPKQGIVSAGRYMMSYGIIRGICVGLGIPYTLIRPATWKKAMMPDMAKEKNESVVRVKQLYPEIKKLNHGQADAILIGLYGVKGRG